MSVITSVRTASSSSRYGVRAVRSLWNAHRKRSISFATPPIHTARLTPPLNTSARRSSWYSSRFSRPATGCEPSRRSRVPGSCASRRSQGVPDSHPRGHPHDAGGRRAAGGVVAVVALLAIVGVGAAGALRTDPDADRSAASIAVFPLLALLGAAAAAAALTTVLARRRLMPDPEDEEEEADAARSRWLRFALLLLPLAVAGALIFAIAV